MLIYVIICEHKSPLFKHYVLYMAVHGFKLRAQEEHLKAPQLSCHVCPHVKIIYLIFISLGPLLGA